MSVDRDEVERIAGLAKLRFDDVGIERLTAELNAVLGHVEVLRTLAESAVELDGDPRDHLAPARSGEAGEPDEMGTGPAAIAPLWQDGFFVVPPPPGVHEAAGPTSRRTPEDP